MAIVSVISDRIYSIPPYAVDGGSIEASLAIDASGEYMGTVGIVEFQAGVSGLKVLSAAGGGSMVIRVGNTNTFANAGTTANLGVVKTLSSGLPSGAFDVNGAIVGGVASIPAGGYLAIPMTAGTVNITAGERISVYFNMSARAGADSVQLRRLGSSLGVGTALWPFYGYPYGVQSVGGSATKNDNPALIWIRFDDGTLGWIKGLGLPLSGTLQSLSYNTGSTPDEYCGVFTPSTTFEIDGFGVLLSSVASADDFTMILYQDPLGTPVQLESVSIDADNYSNQNTADTLGTFAPAVTLTAGVTYGVAVRPDTANSISLLYQDLTTGFDDLKKAGHFGTSLKLAGRSNSTGAFTETQVYHAPLFYLNVTGRDDGAGSGGGMLRHPGMNGGANA